jgi:peptidyl-prolyl cis-trans isomerase C
MRFSRSSRTALVLACVAGVALHSAQAADAILIQGPQASITVEDIRADSLRMPEEMRSAVLKRPQTVQQIGSNLYVRRVMADEAQKLRLDQTPDVQAALRIARDKVLSDAYLQHLDKTHAVSDEAALAQARATYQAKPERFKVDEQVRIRHILIEGKDDKAQAKAQEVLKALHSGADFAELAKQNSIDKGTADKGGDLGFFTRGRMVPEFESAAFALKKVGDVSEIVPTQFGLHILQLQERRPAGIQPFEEVRDALVQEIRGSITQGARAAEAQKISAKAQPQTAAIEAFSNSYPAGK